MPSMYMALASPVFDDICVQLIHNTFWILSVRTVGNVVICCPQKFDSVGGRLAVRRDELRLALQFERDVTELAGLRAARFSQCPVGIRKPQVVMCVAVTDEASASQRSTVSLLDAQYFCVEGHGFVHVRHIEIHVAETTWPEVASGVLILLGVCCHIRTFSFRRSCAIGARRS